VLRPETVETSETRLRPETVTTTGTITRVRRTNWQ
jgi:hypothetical protein